MELRFFEAAEREIEESRAWYRQRSEPAETIFLRELDHAVDQVQRGPHRWPSYGGGTRRYVLPTFPYSLINFVEEEVIHVVAVAHEKRKPGYWKKRLRE
jgi:toxin ParE1/3/4